MREDGDGERCERRWRKILEEMEMKKDMRGDGERYEVI